MPVMAFDTYASHKANVAEILCQTAWKSMEEAAAEEEILTKSLGEVDSSGIPYLTFVTDGAWSKRSYNVNYETLSGVVQLKRSNSKNVLVPPNLRKCLESNLHRLRIALIPPENEVNKVPVMKDCGLYQDIQSCFARLTLNMHSLILNMDTNTAEHYNSIVCKFVGGKRKYYSLRRGYETRCEAAALSFNTGDYGPCASNNQPDMINEEYAVERVKFLSDLQKSVKRETFPNIEKPYPEQAATQILRANIATVSPASTSTPGTTADYHSHRLLKA
ncbi:hypothetical protein FQR65_LT14572 [Abscondita terminalis]|nr:hypothetical protein FQR65_LT14572 [Abscondita terminalis]